MAVFEGRGEVGAIAEVQAQRDRRHRQRRVAQQGASLTHALSSKVLEHRHPSTRAKRFVETLGMGAHGIRQGHQLWRHRKCLTARADAASHSARQSAGFKGFASPSRGPEFQRTQAPAGPGTA